MILWVGVPFASLVFGDVFRLLSPWRAIGRAVGWVDGARRDPPSRWPIPSASGAGRRRRGSSSSASASCVGRAGASRRRWRSRAALPRGRVRGHEPLRRRAVDAQRRPFGVYFGLFATLAPLSRRDGVLYARPPVTGAVGLDPAPGTVALLLCAIGITAFDGGSEGNVFNSVAPDLQDFFTSLGASVASALELTLLPRARGHAAADRGDLLGRDRGDGPPRLRRPHSRGELGCRWPTRSCRSRPPTSSRTTSRCSPTRAGHLAPGVRPARGRQRPFGGAGAGIDYSVVSATAIWYVQVGALVTGHVAALVLGHDRALALYARSAGRHALADRHAGADGCFTCLGLYLLSASNS